MTTLKNSDSRIRPIRSLDFFFPLHAETGLFVMADVALEMEVSIYF